MKTKEKILLTIYFLLIFTMIYFAFSSIHYESMYKEAIKQSSEAIVLALEMNVACQTLGNFTTEEVHNKWIDMFLKT